MNSIALSPREPEPRPTIHRPYRSIAVSTRGRLAARSDSDGTLHLQFHRRASRTGQRLRSATPWRAGPLRTCSLVLQTLGEALTLLGEAPSLERSLQLSRLIDPQLARRLSHYTMLNDASYEPLLDTVVFSSQRHSEDSIPLPTGWISASVAAVTDARVPPTERETLVLVRRQKRWELWARMERTNSGSMPCRRYECLCSTDVLPEEPRLAAELLLFAALSRTPREVELSPCMPGLIPASRLKVIESRLGERAFQQPCDVAPFPAFAATLLEGTSGRCQA